MNSDPNRVFSTTMARESFSNYLASVSPVLTEPAPITYVFQNNLCKNLVLKNLVLDINQIIV